MTHPERIQRQNWGPLREPRIGIMLHYDASVSDESSVAWLAGAAVRVSYNWIVLDSGNIIPLAPADQRAWHAGICRPDDARLRYRDANSAFYGISIAATVGDVATRGAKRSITALCFRLFADHGWDRAREVWRIVSHRSQAWPRGRKNDPEGPDLAHPVLSTNEIRGMVAGSPAVAAA